MRRRSSARTRSDTAFTTSALSCVGSICTRNGRLPEGHVTGVVHDHVQTPGRRNDLLDRRVAGFLRRNIDRTEIHGVLGGIGRHFLDLRRMAALRLPHARVNGVPCVCQRMRGQAPKPLDAPVMTMMFFMDRQTLRSRAELARSPSRHPGRPSGSNPMASAPRRCSPPTVSGRSCCLRSRTEAASTRRTVLTEYSEFSKQIVWIDRPRSSSTAWALAPATSRILSQPRAASSRSSIFSPGRSRWKTSPPSWSRARATCR